MRGILIDVNIEGYLPKLLGLLSDASRVELWESLRLAAATFRELGLSARSSDRDIWLLCQREEYTLVTANRNEDKADSLGATLRELNQPHSLPTFTIGSIPRFRKDHDYAKRVADRLLEYLFDIDSYRGTGRMYIP